MTPRPWWLRYYNDILPFPLFGLSLWLWQRWSGRADLAWAIMALPLVYGYLAPGLATNVLGIWRFRGSWMLGRYYVHHGFIYAAWMGFGLWLVLQPLPPSPPWGPLPLISALVLYGALTGFVGWVHDLAAVRCGMLEMRNSVFYAGGSPEAIVAFYAPRAFFWTGVGYALGGAWLIHGAVTPPRFVQSLAIMSIFGILSFPGEPQLRPRRTADL